LAEVTFCPERCIGIRFVSLTGLADALELVCASDTSQETIERCREVGRRMGNDVVVATEPVVLPEISQD
jgi:3-hydroxyacyl-CoA dehydrogenase